MSAHTESRPRCTHPHTDLCAETQRHYIPRPAAPRDAATYTPTRPAGRTSHTPRNRRSCTCMQARFSTPSPTKTLFSKLNRQARFGGWMGGGVKCNTHNECRRLYTGRVVLRTTSSASLSRESLHGREANTHTHHAGGGYPTDQNNEILHFCLM